MKIHRFEKVVGDYVEPIDHQERFGYTLSGFEDFYDICEMKMYRGSVLVFYDYETGKLIQPFEKQVNVSYMAPIYKNGKFWFLQYDKTLAKVTLYSYEVYGTPQVVVELNAKKISLYNLHIDEESLSIVSEDDDLTCYYPESFSFALKGHEHLITIDDDLVYIGSWHEEGWDEENNCISDSYQYYYKLLIKDFKGNLIREEVGNLQKGKDGKWWLS